MLVSATKLGRRLATNMYKGITASVVGFALLTGTNPYKIGFDQISGLTGTDRITPIATTGEVRNMDTPIRHIGWTASFTGSKPDVV